MGLYGWLKLFHVLGVGAFLFAHGISGGASFVLRGRQPDAVSKTLLQLSIRSSAVTYPMLVVILATGIWMGFLGSWWHSGWIWTAIAILVIVIVVMGALSVPYHRARDVKTAELDDQALEPLRGSRPVIMAVVGVIGLIAIFFVMVVKPF